MIPKEKTTNQKNYKTILSRFPAFELAGIINMNKNQFIKILSGDMKPKHDQEKKLIRLARLLEYKLPEKLDYTVLSKEFKRPGELLIKTYLF